MRGVGCNRRRPVPRSARNQLKCFPFYSRVRRGAPRSTRRASLACEVITTSVGNLQTESQQPLAERAKTDPAFLRYLQMARAWRALADGQDWLDGEIPPVAADRLQEIQS